MGPANSAEKHGDVSDDDSKDGVPEYGASGITKEVGKLIGGLEPWNFMTFHSVGNVIIPIDFHFFIFSELWVSHQPVNITGISLKVYGNKPTYN